MTVLESGRADVAVMPDGLAQRHPGLIATYVLTMLVAFGVVAVLWFVLLSGWLGVTPGSMFVTHQNVLFNSDTNLWIAEMVDRHPPFTRAVHPLQMYLWRPPVQALGHLLQLVGDV